MKNAPKKSDRYWRGIVAAGAEIERNLVTQFSPKGLAEWAGNGEWWHVKLGPLVLTHEHGWVFSHRRETLKERLQYAHRTWQEALAALRTEVAPDDPTAAIALEHIKGSNPLPKEES